MMSQKDRQALRSHHTPTCTYICNDARSVTDLKYHLHGAARSGSPVITNPPRSPSWTASGNLAKKKPSRKEPNSGRHFRLHVGERHAQNLNDPCPATSCFKSLDREQHLPVMPATYSRNGEKMRHPRCKRHHRMQPLPEAWNVLEASLKPALVGGGFPCRSCSPALAHHRTTPAPVVH